VIADDVAFVGALCYRFVVLMHLLQEHLDDYDSLLPHVLMGDVTRWVVQTFNSDAADATLQQMLDFIESAFEEGRSEELISVSFLENLPRPGQGGAEVRALLGPALQDQLRQIG
jgi:hypothetical protein